MAPHRATTKGTLLFQCTAGTEEPAFTKPQCMLLGASTSRYVPRLADELRRWDVGPEVRDCPSGPLVAYAAVAISGGSDP